MRQKQTFSHETEIDLGAMLYVLWRRLWIVILAAIIGGSVGVVYSTQFQKKEYESTTKVIVLFHETENFIPFQNELITGGMMVGDYREIIKSRAVMEEVKKITEVDIPIDGLLSMTSVNVVDSTRVIVIKVKADDPYVAQKLANAIREVSCKRIVEVMDIDAVNVVDKADLQINPINNDEQKNALMFAVIGIVIAVAIIIGKFLIDDTIIIPDDVDTYLELSVLGVIPFDDGKEKKRKRKNHKKKR